MSTQHENENENSNNDDRNETEENKHQNCAKLSLLGFKACCKYMTAMFPCCYRSSEENLLNDHVTSPITSSPDFVESNGNHCSTANHPGSQQQLHPEVTRAPVSSQSSALECILKNGLNTSRSPSPPHQNLEVNDQHRIAHDIIHAEGGADTSTPITSYSDHIDV